MKQEPKATAYRRLTTRETWALVDLLNRVCTRVDAEWASYIEGYDDERVANEALPEFPGDKLQSVMRVRLDLFGKIRAVKAEPQQAMSRLATAEAEIAYLRKAVVWLAKNFDLNISDMPQ